MIFMISKDPQIITQYKEIPSGHADDDLPAGVVNVVSSVLYWHLNLIMSEIKMKGFESGTLEQKCKAVK